MSHTVVNMDRYLLLLTFGTAELLQHDMMTVQFTYGWLSPAGSLFRAMLLSLNQSQLLCRNQELISYPADIRVYGGPYFAFVVQILACYAFLVCHDSGKLPKLKRFLKLKGGERDPEKHVGLVEDSVIIEERDVEVSDDALRVLHVSKKFGRRSNTTTAVEDVTFGVRRGGIFGLLG